MSAALNVLQMPYSEYHDRPGFRSSSIRHIKRSPRHYLASLDETPTSDALAFGKAFHAAILEPHVFRDKMAMYPAGDGRTKVVSMARAEFMASLQPDQILVKHEWMDQITGMLESVQENAVLSAMLKDGVRESSYFWTDPETGLAQKCRWDYITTGGIPIDFKTIVDADQRSVERAIFDYDEGYYLNCGHYSAGAEANGSVRNDLMMLAFIEKKRPWGITLKVLDHYVLDAGKFERAKALRKLKECTDKNLWPCYPPSASPAIPPKWFEDRFKEM